MKVDIYCCGRELETTTNHKPPEVEKRFQRHSWTPLMECKSYVPIVGKENYKNFLMEPTQVTFDSNTNEPETSFTICKSRGCIYFNTESYKAIAGITIE